MDEELDQAPHRALVHYRVVERERGERDGPIAPYFGGKHGALLDRMAAGEDLGHRVDHVGRSDVGHETEPSLVDADQGHAMRRQMPRARSVMKPCRPWLTPTWARRCSATCRAALSLVLLPTGSKAKSARVTI